MTPQDKELQELRRECKRLTNRNRRLEELRQCDLAEITTLRRQVDFLMESQEVRHDKRQR